MRHSLQSHIIYLETLLQDLRSQLASSRLNTDEVQDLELQVTLAESALEHYRQAFILECSVASSEPPPQPGSAQPGTQTGGGTGSAQKPHSDKKNGGRTAIKTTGRTRTARPSRRQRMPHISRFPAPGRQAASN